jgi:hypothetical protein
LPSILRSIVFAALGFFIVSTPARAYLTNAKMPACLDGPDEMRVDNARVLKFKTTTPNQYLDRAFVEGNVTEAPDVKNGHDHFIISIGPDRGDTLEIIYNKEFGAMPEINVGDRVAVCGDYITSTQRAGRYDPSPAGAIMHWIHFNPGNRSGSARHEHGFVMIGSNLIGFDDAPSSDWSGRITRTAEPNHGAGDRARSSPVSVEGGQNSQMDSAPRRRNDRRQNGRRVDTRRWQPCRSLDDCRARNG